MIQILTVFSYLPFFVLHRISDFIFLILFYIVGYRRKTVQENLARSFPNETPEWRSKIERKFYRNFCDIMMETVKATSISKEAMTARCAFVSEDLAHQWEGEKKNVAAIASHLASWEWLGISTSIRTRFDCYAVFKPLSSNEMNAFIKRTRGRFGLQLIPMKELRAFFESPKPRTYMLGLLSDQAPHDYSKAFEVDFLNQKTYYFPGPGVLCVKYNLVPCWMWLRRTEKRSCFEWGMELIAPDHTIPLNQSEKKQMERMSKAHSLTWDETERAYRIVKEYSRLLEAKIKMAPEDWLWSHRRWKTR